MSDAKKPSPMLELAQRMIAGELPPPPVATLVGMKAIVVEPGHAVFELEAGERHANPMGTLHGGILCDLADGAMGFAYEMSFVRPVWKGLLTADAKVFHGGKTVGLVECTITDAQGRLVAKASSTCLTLRGSAASGR